jgi:psiF repeat
MSMSLRLLAISATFAFAGAAFAATPQASTTAPAKTLTPSQQHMADCSHQNAGKKGDDYKNAVSACMKGDTAAAPTKTLTPSQQRMADCNHQNAGKKGDDYKNAVSACMKTH